MKNLILSLLILLHFPLMAVTCNRPMVELDDPPLHDIKLPPGFQISIFAKVDNARSLALGTNGTVFVGNREGKKVTALVDKNGDGIAEKQFVIADGMTTPNGVAFKDGDLYVAEVSKIWKFTDIENRLENPGEPALIYDQLPTDKHHGWKYIAFGPDGKLYIPIGAPCNICDNTEKDPRYASITRMNADGTGFEIFAHGIRNSVGFAWHPTSGELWFTENGRDMMGDDIPHDELNHAPKAGMHFGYPFIHADDVIDPEFGKGKNPADYTRPIQKLNPHGAALGMKFYTGKQFPEQYKNQVFIAEHGSWNRSTPIGYRVSLVRLEGNKAVAYEDFASGWLKDGEAWGRPVDVLQLPDGSLLVSDDHAGLVYRISYKK